jgi:hypothetical protein
VIGASQIPATAPGKFAVVRETTLGSTEIPGARVSGIVSPQPARGAAMRIMMKMQLDTEAGSRAIADGSLPS